MTYSLVPSSSTTEPEADRSYTSRTADRYNNLPVTRTSTGRIYHIARAAAVPSHSSLAGRSGSDTAVSGIRMDKVGTAVERLY